MMFIPLTIMFATASAQVRTMTLTAYTGACCYGFGEVGLQRFDFSPDHVMTPQTIQDGSSIAFTDESYNADLQLYGLNTCTTQDDTRSTYINRSIRVWGLQTRGF